MPTNKERLDANNRKIQQIQQNLKNKVVEANKETIDTLKGVLDGSLVEFDNTKLELESLASYRFSEFKNLTSVNFKGITEVPNYCCYTCTKLANLVLDENITSIGDFAFYACRMDNFKLDFKSTCNIGANAFNSNGKTTGLYSINGKLGNIGNYAFAGPILSLTDIDVTINGKIGANAFKNAFYVNNFKISKDSVVSGTLDDYCFSGVGSSRSNPQNSIFDLDFSNSKITIIDQYAFGTSSSSYKNRYYSIQFPATLGTINSYAFRYSDNMTLYFKGLVPASLNSNAFNNATNLKICVNYASVNAYKTATNWATYADNIIGYADRDTFAQGQQLPQYSLEGYALTWYSDIDLTQQVTTAESPSNYYYCTIGAEQVDVVGITSLYQDNCIIEVVDNETGHAYTEGEGILIGRNLTITATPTISGYVPYILTFNGVDFTSPYSYTTVSGENIKLVGIYYNGVDVPVSQDFNQNSWAIIKSVIQSGNAGQYWTVGSVKEIEIDGVTYGVRLSDLQAGRYNYSSGNKTTNAVLEFVQLYNTSYRMNATDTNAGGWALSELYTTINTTIFNKLPTELRSLLEEVIVKSANGGGSNYTEITESNNKLFIPCAEEVALSVSSYGRTGEGTTWDYYIGAGNEKRIKYLSGSAQFWRLRSPYPTGTTGFSSVGYSGNGDTFYASVRGGVCPCFAW